MNQLRFTSKFLPNTGRRHNAPETFSRAGRNIDTKIQSTWHLSRLYIMSVLRVENPLVQWLEAFRSGLIPFILPQYPTRVISLLLST